MSSPVMTLNSQRQRDYTHSPLALPTELTVTVLRLALKTSKPWLLASLSKSCRDLVYDIIYSVVVLDSVKKIHQFHTISNVSPRTLLYVRKLVISDGSWAWKASQGEPSKISDIISACAAIHILEVPTLELLPSGMSKATHPVLVELTAMEARRAFGSSAALCQLKIERLRIAGSPFGFGPFVPPCDILSQLNNPSNLTHLEFSRLANSNQVNDVKFASDIANILQSGDYPELRVLVVTIIGPDAVDSDLWKLIEGIKTTDSRLVVIQGKGVEDEMRGFDFTAGFDLRSRFWTRYDRPSP